MQLLNIFHSGGLWFIPFVLLLASAWSFYRAYQSHNSNSTTNTDTGVKNNTGNVEYWKIGSFWFGVALLVAAIVSFVMIVSDYKGV